MSTVTAADNAVRGIGKYLPGARSLGIVGRGDPFILGIS